MKRKVYTEWIKLIYANDDLLEVFHKLRSATQRWKANAILTKTRFYYSSGFVMEYWLSDNDLNAKTLFRYMKLWFNLKILCFFRDIKIIKTQIGECLLYGVVTIASSHHTLAYLELVMLFFSKCSVCYTREILISQKVNGRYYVDKLGCNSVTTVRHWF